MKIIFSDATLMHGGAERVISILANSLCELGHDVEILLFFDREIWYTINEKIKITVAEKHIKRKNILSHIVWRRKYIKNAKPDVVISFLAQFNMINIISMLGLKIPLIVADRNDPSKIPTNFILRKLRDFLYRFADRVVVQNESNREYFSLSVQKKSSVIYNPIELGEYSGAALKCDEKENTIVSVGRVIKQKNPLMLFEAFGRISEEFPNYKLVYYGDGVLKNEIRQRAQQLNISERVILPGAVKDVFNKIKNSKLFVMTSDYEGMPNALLEAMCLGLPVISTKVSGATDVIENGKNGILVDCRNVEQLEDAMRKLLRKNELRESMASEAVKLSGQLKTEYIVELWIECINNVIQKKNISNLSE